MALIKLGKIRQKFIYPLIMCFFYFCEQFFFLCYIKKEKQNTSNQDPFSHFSPIYHPYILVWLHFIVQIFGIIPLLIQSKLSKSERIKNLLMLSQNMNENTPTYRFSWKLLFILILLSFTESITMAAGIIFDVFPYSLFKICSQTCLIILTSFICVKFLKYEYFRHHNFSIALIFCASILYAIFDTLQDNGTLKANSLIYIVEVILVLVLRGSQECVEKWLMDKKYLSPYFLMFAEGLTGFITSSLMFLVYSIIPCAPKGKVYHCEWEKTENFFISMNYILHDSWYIVFLILYMISNYFFVIFKLLTNKSLSPSHRSSSDILGLFLIWVLRVLWIDKAFKLDHITDSNHEEKSIYSLPHLVVNIVKLISYLVMIFAIFVFLEILVVSFCNLDIDTDDKIDTRSYQERVSLNNLLEEEKKRKYCEEQNISLEEVDIPYTQS